MTYQKFPKEYTPSEQELCLLDELGFKDVSWINDSCPSWECGSDQIQLYIDAIDPNHREHDGPRFAIAINRGEINSHWISQSTFAEAIKTCLNANRE